jgi:serine/threonine protein kinase
MGFVGERERSFGVVALRGQHLIGKVLGSCVLERLLGYGGSSAVFLAQQKNPERKVAIKVFLPRVAMDIHMQRDFYRRFLREAEAASKLEHANILPIYSYGEQDGLPYIMMPYMPGGTLADYLAKRGALSLKEAQWYLEQMAAALDFAHAHGCVHCDVKPANILLDSDGLVMLSDFGIAHLTQTEIDPEQTDVKHPEAVMGTPDFISPEQALGQTLDGRSDVYSLGVTFFFMLSKRLPFQADSAIALALLHVHESPPSLALLRADITPLLDRVVLKALAKDPQRRFQSAGEFSAAFAAAVSASEKRPSGADFPLFDDDAGYLAAIPHVPIKSVVKIKPARKRAGKSSSLKSSSFKNIFFICVTLVIVVFSTVLAFALFGQNPVPPVAIATPLATTAVATSTQMPQFPLKHTGVWPTSQGAFFDSEHRYHMKGDSKTGVSLAFFPDAQILNFKLDVTMLEIAPRDANKADFQGVVFRASSDETRYYMFEIAPYSDGQYNFESYSEYSKAATWDHLGGGTSTAIVPGENNTITVEASGNSFYFLVNGEQVLQTDLKTSSVGLQSGMIGLYVEDAAEEVAFSQLTVEANH